jgi:hypothetical protein
MSTRRKFTFPLATLTRAAGLLKSALADPAYTAPMAARLGAGFAADFEGKITAVTGKGTAQSGQTGTVADLTKEQREQFEEMERLTAGARRTARLAFPGDTTRLREEFQVGIDEPKTLAAETERAGKVHAACVRHATALSAKGWIATDTTALGEVVAALTGADLEQEEALDDRIGLTNEKIIAANALYEACLTIQNAARLQYPAKKDAQGNALNVTERARFLLDEFPPRDRSQPEGGTQGGGTPPTSATAKP